MYGNHSETNSLKHLDPGKLPWFFCCFRQQFTMKKFGGMRRHRIMPWIGRVSPNGWCNFTIAKKTEVRNSTPSTFGGVLKLGHPQIIKTSTIWVLKPMVTCGSTILRDPYLDPLFLGKFQTRPSSPPAFPGLGGFCSHAFLTPACSLKMALAEEDSGRTGRTPVGEGG